MFLKTIISAPKRNVKGRVWSQEKPARRDFPLSRKQGGRFPITRKWRWTVVEFDVDRAHFRLIVAYHTGVPNFQMVLGEALGSDTRVLCRVEYDVAHSRFGWHVHSFCDDTAEISPGVIKPHGQRRIPAASSYHRRRNYTLNGDSMNDIIALDLASDWFNFIYQKPLGID